MFDTEVLTVDPASFPYPRTSLNAPHTPPFNLHSSPPTQTYAKDLDNLFRAASILKQQQQATTTLASSNPTSSSASSPSASSKDSPSTPSPVAFPTETVYGLGANATSSTCIQSIFTVKGRPSDNPLIVHVSSLDMLRSILPDGFVLPDIYVPILEAFWPGPLTVLLPRSDKIPAAVTAGHATVAVRMPQNPIARALIDACGFPIAAPSANTSGRPSPTKASHVLQDLSGKIPIILDGGDAEGGVESTVLDGLSTPPAILRPGGVTLEQLKAFPGMEALRVYKRDFVDKGMEMAPVTPGMKYRHYSPRMQVILFERAVIGVGASKGGSVRTAVDVECVAILADAPRGSKVGILRTSREEDGDGAEGPRNDSIVEVNLGDSPLAVAHNLFSGLRQLEGEGVVAILVEGIDEDREGLAVMNRLRKAASKTILVE
ncbi:hypothetical protein HDU97_001556 [Phlyctochytrium planicorne]|nr:hypothetical protein HDU97_001556 [Phlyctochytrium planicorne]